MYHLENSVRNLAMYFYLDAMMQMHIFLFCFSNQRHKHKNTMVDLRESHVRRFVSLPNRKGLVPSNSFRAGVVRCSGFLV